MAQSSFPFENIDTTETQYSQLFRTLNNGVNGTPDGGELEVNAASAGLAVDITAGQAMVRGHFYLSTAVETRSFAVADATNDRIDLVVLRLDPIANSVVLEVKTGVPDPSPVAPALVLTDGGIFEQPIAEVLVPANAGVPSTITDRREFMGTKLGTWTTDGRPIPGTRVLFGFNTTLEAVEFYNTITEAWEEITPASINDIGDVTITTPADGQVLAYDDGDWVNQALTAAQLPTGSILQVVSTTKTDTFTSSATTFTTITGMSASITPTATDSKVLVVVNVKGASNNAANDATFHYRIVRDSTAIAIGDANSSRARVTGNLGTRLSGSTVLLMADTSVFLDSPATSSSVTYSVEGRNSSASTWYVNRFEGDVDNGFYLTSVSSITLIEVAG